MNELQALYIVLAVGIALLSVWGSIVLYRLSRVLSRLEKTLATTNHITNMVESTVAGVVPVATSATNVLKKAVEYAHSFLTADELPEKKK